MVSDRDTLRFCTFCLQSTCDPCYSMSEANGCYNYTRVPKKITTYKDVMGLEKKVKSDGGSTDYYKLPAGATELADLIEHKKMDFNVGNIFKACYRLGEKEGNDLLYDINKIIYFAERLKKQVEKAR